MKIVVVGATGMVGKVMLEILQDCSIPISELLVVASSKSVGRTLSFNNKNLTIISLEDAITERPNLYFLLVDVSL